MCNENKRRPAADYIWQTRKLIGNCHYIKTISQQPLVDIYQQGNKNFYVVINPQDSQAIPYQLNLGAGKKAAVYHLTPSADAATRTMAVVVQGKLKVIATSTPTLIETL